MYTNGTLITDEVAGRMAELSNISPAISVEGFEEETDARRGKEVYRHILKAMMRLRKYGVPFGISATPTKYNWEVITSESFVDFFFFEQGAFYGWLFQYMPVGRGQSLELVVPPRERVEMLYRMRRLVQEKKVFLTDFWNSGMASNGCISAGRPGGYYYIDWNGNITPCVFVPYSPDNIYRIYEEGGDISTVLSCPFFKSINEWQFEYGYKQSAENTNNWLCPCIMRDHFHRMKEVVAEYKSAPINAEAAAAMEDEAYYQGMIRYGEEIRNLTESIWKEQFLSPPAEEDGVDEIKLNNLYLTMAL